MRFIDRLVFPPKLASDDATARARIFFGVAWVTTCVASLLLLILGVEETHTLPRRLRTIAVLFVIGSSVVVWNSSGRTRSASWLFVSGLTALVGQRALSSGGLTTPAVLWFLVLTMIAGLLLDTLGSVVFALACATVGFVMMLAARAGALPPSQLTYTPLALWWYSLMSLGITVLVLRQITQALGSSLARAQAQASARAQAERRLRLAVEAGGFVSWDYDVTSRTFCGGPGLYELYGVARPPGDRNDYEAWMKRIHPDDRAAAERALREIEQGSASMQIEFRILRPDRATRYIESAGAAVLDDQTQRRQVVGVARDVTERKQAEHQRVLILHELGERIKELRLLHTAARMLQLHRPSDEPLFQELVDMIPAAFQFPECCAATIQVGAIRVVSALWRETPWLLTTTFRTSEGEGSIAVVYLEERPSAQEGPFLAEERALVESLAEMIAGHAELRRHHDHLEELVSRKTQELRIAVAAADRANQAKSTFLATMSHEIRTPMNAMLGYAQLLRRDRSLTPEQQEKIETILASGDHLLTLISNVLEMSKIEAGRARLALEPFDLHALLESVRQMFRELARAKRLELVFAPFDHLPRVVAGDAGKVRQVLINLLSNAMKFSGHGRVTVTSRTTQRADGSCLIAIDVADQGPGISAEDLERLFTAFEQSQLGARAGGTGLGLSISRELARLMEGDLTVASEPGAGSVFTFSFLARATTRQVVPHDRSSGVAIGLLLDGGPPRVLVVDDQAENRALLAELLTMIGFQTREASSGHEAIALHDSWRPDLILMDLRMPGMGGVSAIRQLRASGSQAVIVACTASGLEQECAAALEAGAEETLSKPYREAYLLERIGALLGLRYAYQQKPTSVPPAAAASLGSTSTLSELLHGLPDELRAELRDAVLEARPARIEALAERVATHSPLAAQEIMALVRNFAYEPLSEALGQSR